MPNVNASTNASSPRVEPTRGSMLACRTSSDLRAWKMPAECDKSVRRNRARDLTPAFAQVKSGFGRVDSVLVQDIGDTVVSAQLCRTQGRQARHARSGGRADE